MRVPLGARWWLPAAMLALLASSGCADAYLRSADDEASSIQRQKQAEVRALEERKRLGVERQKRRATLALAGVVAYVTTPLERRHGGVHPADVTFSVPLVGGEAPVQVTMLGLDTGFPSEQTNM